MNTKRITMSRIIELPSKMITLGTKNLDKALFTPVTNRNFWVKPNGGLWSCPYTPNGEYVSAWHEWCMLENYYNGLSDDAVVFEVSDDARWYVIDTQQDLIDLIAIVGEAEPIISSVYKGEPFQRFIDFEKASQMFDIIYLTDQGQWQTRMPINQYRAYSLYGWDCASTLILNYDVITRWYYKKLNIFTDEIRKGQEESDKERYRWMMEVKIQELAKVIKGRRI